MKRMLSTAYEDLTLSDTQYEALTSTGSVQLDFSEYPEGLARLHNSNVITIYTSPDHLGKNIVLKRQTQTETKAIFAAIEKDNSTLKEYSIEVTLPVNGEGGALNIGLAEVVIGDIFEGNVTITGILNAAQINTPILTSASDEISAQKPVVEVMAGYSAAASTETLAGKNITLTPVYLGICKNGNKITFAVSFKIKRTGTAPDNNAVIFFVNVPLSIWEKIYPTQVGTQPNFIDAKSLEGFYQIDAFDELPVYFEKRPNEAQLRLYMLDMNNKLALDREYFARYECTILLSENLVS